jgi:hypothetical protein
MTIERGTAVFRQNHRQLPVPNPTWSLTVAWSKGVGNCCSEKQRDLTKFAVDAGASPRTACVLAAIHSMADSASATEPGVRRSHSIASTIDAKT